MNIARLVNYQGTDKNFFEVIGHRDALYEDDAPLIGAKGFIFKNNGIGSSHIFLGVSSDNKMHQAPPEALILKIFIENEEEIIMGKRVGNFVNPANGEVDWFEPNTISMIVLQPKMVTRVGQVNQSAIEFKLASTDDEEFILITAEYTADGVTYKSDSVLIPSEAFADEWAPLVYSERALDEADMIKNAKDQLTRDLTMRLMDNNILMGGMQFVGSGYVSVNDQKVMTLEVIDFEYAVQGSTPTFKATIRNVVSQASFANLESPKITLWTGKHRIDLVAPVMDLALSHEGRIKEYTLIIKDIVVVSESTEIDFQNVNTSSFKTDEEIDAYIESRKVFLSDLSGEDEEFDDRFNDLF